MAKAKFTKHEIEAVITNLVSATEKHYTSHSFAAGYLAEALAGVMEGLPRHLQAEILATMSTTTNRFVKEVTI